MAADQTTLRIKAEKLGTVNGVKGFLTDLESAYNNIYVFDFLVESLVYQRERNLREFDERFRRTRQYLREFSNRKDFPYDPFYSEMIWENIFHQPRNILPSLLELQSQLDYDKIVFPGDRLTILRVNIQSPGFWEFLGALNPLEQIREYLKDRHERQKDRKYRSRQEEELGQLAIQEKENNILTQRIETLKSLGYGETEIRQLVMTMVINPLNKLNEHQDRGQIEAPENSLD